MLMLFLLMNFYISQFFQVVEWEGKSRFQGNKYEIFCWVSNKTVESLCDHLMLCVYLLLDNALITQDKFQSMRLVDCRKTYSFCRTREIVRWTRLYKAEKNCFIFSAEYLNIFLNGSLVTTITIAAQMQITMIKFAATAQVL